MPTPIFGQPSKIRTSKTGYLPSLEKTAGMSAIEAESYVLEWMKQAGFIDSYAYDQEKKSYRVHKGV
jgi:hypothetical protein